MQVAKSKQIKEVFEKGEKKNPVILKLPNFRVETTSVCLARSIRPLKISLRENEWIGFGRTMKYFSFAKMQKTQYKKKMTAVQKISTSFFQAYHRFCRDMEDSISVDIAPMPSGFSFIILYGKWKANIVFNGR